MKITFISNYINHHQIPFCRAMAELIGEGFTFIQTEPMEEERVRMGWAVDVRKYPYVHLYYEEKEYCDALIRDCDLLMAGWMEDISLIMPRLSSGKPAFRVSERIYREGQWKAVSPRGLAAKYREHICLRKLPVYLLCAGAYVASDFALIGAYPGKKLRFGYFPETRDYGEADRDRLPEKLRIKKEESDVLTLMWAGRLMPLKHPEYMLRLAKALKKEGIPFRLRIVGSGELEQQIREGIASENLQGQVEQVGFMPPEQVRDAMERSHIYLFTSNHLEGWGAVVNEAMNSGCAVVAGRDAGAVPSLITDEKNGMIYDRDNCEEMIQKVLQLARDKNLREQMGAAAYRTIREEWNARNAAARCLETAKALAAGEDIHLPKEGPFSPAPVIRPRFTLKGGKL